MGEKKRWRENESLTLVLCIIIFLLPSQIPSFLTLGITSAFSSIAVSLPVMSFSPLSLSCWFLQVEHPHLSLLHVRIPFFFFPPFFLFWMTLVGKKGWVAFLWDKKKNLGVLNCFILFCFCSWKCVKTPVAIRISKFSVMKKNSGFTS